MSPMPRAAPRSARVSEEVAGHACWALAAVTSPAHEGLGLRAHPLRSPRWLPYQLDFHLHAWWRHAIELAADFIDNQVGHRAGSRGHRQQHVQALVSDGHAIHE